MLRILQSVNIMERAGLETMLMNYYRHIDRSIIQFDFLTHRTQMGAYEKEIIDMGGRVYHAPRLYPQNLPHYYKFMHSFFSEHEEYQVVHSHIDAMSYFPLSAAKQNHIPIRIAHSHSSKLERDFKLPIKFFALKSIHTVANYKCACGKIAGDFMFPNKDFKIIHNAIDLSKFRYNESVRKEVRKKLNLDKEFVIGHVGRFCYIKNQLFLLDIFSEILKIKKNAVLLLIGKGTDEGKIRARAKELGIQNKVQLLIDRPDVDKLYQAFDVFAMPSLFEGLPVVGVEAQANGLPCIVSNKISNEVLLTNNIKMLSIEASASSWAKEIVNVSPYRNPNAENELRSKGYDINIEAQKLQDWYLQLHDTMKAHEVVR